MLSLPWRMLYDWITSVQRELAPGVTALTRLIPPSTKGPVPSRLHSNSFQKAGTKAPSSVCVCVYMPIPNP